MKIRERSSNQIFEVYGVYWQGEKTYFCCFPKNAKGISSYVEDEIDIVDESISNNFIYLKSSNMINGFFHKALVENGLLDSLFEHDPQAFDKFVEILGREP